VKLVSSVLGAFALFLCFGQGLAIADPNGDPAAVKQDPTTGIWQDKAGNPTFKVGKDGTVDWYTSVGYLQYGANCLVCHGPDALGSSYAPNLTESLKSLSYAEVYGIIVSGKRDVSSSQDLVMPAWGNNKNVMCHINAIYVYLRARSDGAVGRGRPSKVGPKPAGFDKQEDACFGD
jgi:methanol metabolism-related c-type cytochrome